MARQVAICDTSSRKTMNKDGKAVFLPSATQDVWCTVTKQEKAQTRSPNNLLLSSS